MKKTKNIEFIFLIILGLIALTLLSLTLGLIISMNNFAKNNPDNSTGGEWVGLGLIILILSIFHATFFFIWQFLLWRTYINTLKRRYVQLSFIFLFGIFPFLNTLLTVFFKEAVGIEHPLTENIVKVFLYILLLPLTGGK